MASQEFIANVLASVDLDALGISEDQILDDMLRMKATRQSAAEARDEVRRWASRIEKLFESLIPTKDVMIVNRSGEPPMIDSANLAGQGLDNNLWVVTVLENKRRTEAGNAAILNNLGYTYMWLGELAAAQEAFKQAIEIGKSADNGINPSSDGIYNSINGNGAPDSNSSYVGASVGDDVQEHSAMPGVEEAEMNQQKLREIVEALFKWQKARRNLLVAR
jgi:tetratricopeptide (TPR) repeat protein